LKQPNTASKGSSEKTQAAVQQEQQSAAASESNGCTGTEKAKLRGKGK